MSGNIHDDPVPLRIEESGNVRIGNTRVTLRTVVAQFLDGAPPEQIVARFDTLALADVYAVLGYYLRHRDEIDARFAQDDREAEALLSGLGPGHRRAAELRSLLEARRAGARPSG